MSRHSGIADIRLKLAELVERMAEHESRFATYLEDAARRGDGERRLRLAASERRAAAEHRLIAEEFRASARFRYLARPSYPPGTP